MVCILINLIILTSICINFKSLVLEIAGEGDFESVVMNSKTRLKLFGSKYEKDGETYLKFDKTLVKIIPGPGKILLKNLFNGKKI